MRDWLQHIVYFAEAVSEWSGRGIAWLTLGMVLVTFFIVIAQKVFNAVWLQESVTYMHALVFMLGAAYTFRDDEHVRVDIFYQKLGQRGRALVNLLGTLLLLGPLVLFILVKGWDYAGNAWLIREGSGNADGLPFVYLLKSVIPLMAILLLIQALAVLARSVSEILYGERG